MQTTGKRPRQLGKGAALRGRLSRPLREFMQAETAGGAVLAAATVVALICANSPLSQSYNTLWETELTLRLGRWELTEDLRHWVNDALMTIFFFVVGLEIKRELVTGELRDKKAAAMPAIAALGGMVVPAAIYLGFNAGTPASRGWGIPMATDIAFSVGVLTLLGKRVPSSLKLFLLSLAIADDIGGIVVIALFYSGGIDLVAFLVAIALVGLILIVRGVRVTWIPAYLALGSLLWLATFESGLHPTLSGVALGMLTPAAPSIVAGRHMPSVAQRLEHQLLPWSSFVVVPLFALANAGISLNPAEFGRAARSPIGLGVALGLLLGKPIGITLFSWLAQGLRLGKLPHRATWRQTIGTSGIAGIGFTVSLFIATLAFEDLVAQGEAKVGILIGSLSSAVLGTALLFKGGDEQR
ncbi:MAG: Na+/H+ antiporter NhaA [Actinomycetota bacterium]|nr:Na+/H+ antiporter NhaA [Actinomycetota bacterium]